MMLLILLSCTGPAKLAQDSQDTSGGGGGVVDTSPGDDTGGGGGPALTAALSGSVAVEPFLGTAPATFLATSTSGASLSAAVLDADGVEQAVLAVEDGGTLHWDGRSDAGDVAPPGTYTVVLTATRGDETVTADWAVDSVRVGVAGGSFSGARIPLIWHSNGGSGRYVQIEADQDSLRVPTWGDDEPAPDLAAPWADLSTAPDEDETTLNLPVAYAWDAVPELSLSFGGTLALSAEAEIFPRVPSWTLLEDGTAAEGTLRFRRDSALAAGPTVVEEDLTIEYVAADGEVIAVQTLPMRAYALLGTPTFDREGVPYGPWVAAIDPALRAISGVEPLQAAVLDALVAHIYNDLGLSYDTRYGASSYVSYSSSWTSARFSFSDFLRRRNGDVINCTDAAAILGAYANMVGADLSYMIINPNFGLNDILAIGGSSFTSCPFGPGGCGFSYHAVTTSDSSGTIYDATLALDGDGDPGNAPNTQLLVQSISGEDYLKALVRSGSPYYHSESKGTIQ